jgi:protein-disulfide isomerase
MSGDITIKKSTFNKLIIGIVSSLVIVSFLSGYIIGNFGETKTMTQNTYQPIPTQTPIQSPGQTRIAISTGDSPVMGNPNAPVTMIEFSDFQCPFCDQFFSQTLPDVEKNYIEPGKVRLVFKNFPLVNLHPNAMTAALAGECSNEQGKFWKYHDILFRNQASWSQLNPTDASKTFKQYASNIGLDTSSFNLCFDSGKYADRINKDLQDGSAYGVNGTPTFFIGNDKKGYTELDGAQPFSVFQQELDSELG